VLDATYKVVAAESDFISRKRPAGFFVTIVLESSLLLKYPVPQMNSLTSIRLLFKFMPVRLDYTHDTWVGEVAAQHGAI
jgi:hypothetical protein